MTQAAAGFAAAGDLRCKPATSRPNNADILADMRVSVIAAAVDGMPKGHAGLDTNSQGLSLPETLADHLAVAKRIQQTDRCSWQQTGGLTQADQAAVLAAGFA